MDRVDLHLHTWASDGKSSPGELVGLAKQEGLRAIAITDHDCIDGIKEALEAGDVLGIEVIPGVELSIQYKNFKDIHILGYYFDWEDPRLHEVLAEFKRRRKERGERMLEKINLQLLREGKKPLEQHRVLEEAKGTLGRLHIARKLVEEGHAGSTDEAFTRYLIPNNVPKAKFSPEEALRLVRELRGLSVLAHPNLISQSLRIQREIIEEFKEWGLDGVEAFYPGCRNEDRQLYDLLRHTHHLVLTGGSDFHGDSSRTGLGMKESGLSYRMVEGLKERTQTFYATPTLPNRRATR